MKTVEETLKAFAHRNSLDAIVMVISVQTDDFPGSSNQQFRGAGLCARGVGNMTAVSTLHLLSSVAVMDGKTGKPFSTRVLLPPLKGYPQCCKAKWTAMLFFCL